MSHFDETQDQVTQPVKQQFLTFRQSGFSLSWFVVLALVVAIITSACSREKKGAANSEPPPQSVRAVQAVAQDVPLEIAAIGNVEAVSTIEVKARITAPVLRVNFAEGQEVRKGELLFELDAEPFHRQIAEIEANIARNVANIKQVEANIARDQAMFRNLEAIASRGQKLLSEGIFSRDQAEQANTNVAAAKATLDADRAAIESAKAAEKAERARLMATRLQLDYTKVYAPIAGRAGTIAVKQGGLAKQNDNTLVTLLQTTPVYVTFSVPENMLPEIRKYNRQKPLTITATTADKRVSNGTLQFIDNSIDPTTGGIKLKALFTNPERVLWPGQFLNVKARLSLEPDRILITSQSVQTGPQGKFVWVLNPADSTVSIREVTVLRIYTPEGQAEQSVIGAGLTAGETVISEGQKRLSPKAKVRVLPPDGKADSRIEN